MENWNNWDVVDDTDHVLMTVIIDGKLKQLRYCWWHWPDWVRWSLRRQMVCLHCTKVVRPEPASGTTPYHNYRYHSYHYYHHYHNHYHWFHYHSYCHHCSSRPLTQGLTSISAYLATFVKLGNSRKECLRDLGWSWNWTDDYCIWSRNK